jgi:hypothetical protein
MFVIYLASYKTVKALTVGFPACLIVYLIVDYHLRNNDYADQEKVLNGNILINNSTVMYLGLIIAILISSPGVLHMTVVYIPMLFLSVVA